MMKEEFIEELKGEPGTDLPTANDAFDSRKYKRESGEKAAQLILGMTGEDVRREGLLRTPHRFAKAFDHLFQGYDLNPQTAVGEGVFDSEGKGLVSVENVEFYSMCEHHLLPFWGTATVAYFPDKKILGLSKIPRLLETYARRVQVQERITEQVAAAIQELIAPRAVLVQVKAQHLCMMMRGVEKQTSFTLTEKVEGFDSLQAHEQQQFLSLMGRR
ncbi:GTP cyclohydrolase I FolE [Pseudobacteriovorax antillogorgiicola]|uniref:GTP cyclohydrolase 1 n=1 Tax=Pseudobacteriovorax antillogorgiicola TaxID=1513793 RepID=A0A1Y6CFU2_9BACT|nr:GTP cyclohydrolase I FolE [Pseudobacteriovorax antillogorgiicola]TCS47317.1 GTP cyclohydrolase I [Pseudobacteriovorax antillogorgiicola]SMF62776.1 GTP cyclohydrolase I [Pseudobacteriovorax antillogorgiicola]